MAFAMIAVSPRSPGLAERFGLGTVIAAGFSLVAVGFGIASQFTPTTPYAVIAVAVAFLGAGMGMAVAPSTGSIMSAVPMAKAGVGSAVNDTTREVGGALGIAVLGSVVTSAYRGALDLDGIALTPGAEAAARNSVGAAVHIGKQIPGGDLLVSRAGEAFTHAFNVSAGASVGVALLAATLAFLIFGRTPPMHGGAGGGELSAADADLVAASD
jgi:hypothetical protein